MRTSLHNAHMVNVRDKIPDGVFLEAGTKDNAYS